MLWMAYIPYISSFEPLCLGPKSSISWIHQKTRPWKTPTVHGPEASAPSAPWAVGKKVPLRSGNGCSCCGRSLPPCGCPQCYGPTPPWVAGYPPWPCRTAPWSWAWRITPSVACNACSSPGHGWSQRQRRRMRRMRRHRVVATAALGLRAGTECDMDPPWGFDLSLQSQGERTQPTMLSRFSIDTRFLRGILGSCHSLCFVGMGFPANWPANFPLFIHRNCLRGGWLKHVHEDRFLDTKSKGCVKLEVSLVSPLVCPWVVCISYAFFLVQVHAWCLGTSLTSHSCCHCDQLMWHPERKKNASNV